MFIVTEYAALKYESLRLFDYVLYAIVHWKPKIVKMPLGLG